MRFLEGPIFRSRRRRRRRRQQRRQRPVRRRQQRRRRRRQCSVVTVTKTCKQFARMKQIVNEFAKERRGHGNERKAPSIWSVCSRAHRLVSTTRDKFFRYKPNLKFHSKILLSSADVFSFFFALQGFFYKAHPPQSAHTLFSEYLVVFGRFFSRALLVHRSLNSARGGGGGDVEKKKVLVLLDPTELHHAFDVRPMASHPSRKIIR